MIVAHLKHVLAGSVLITGGAGFIGCNLADALMGDGAGLLVQIPHAFFVFHSIQLVMQRFQADTEDFRRSCLVVARVIQGQQNQSAFRFVHGGPR